MRRWAALIGVVAASGCATARGPAAAGSAPGGAGARGGAATTAAPAARLKVAIDDGVAAPLAALSGAVAPYLHVEAVPLRARLRAIGKGSAAAAQQARQRARHAGRAALAAARSAYKKLDFAAVTSRCQAAEPMLRRRATARADVELLGKLLLLRAQAHLALKQGPAAKQALAFAVDLGVVRAGAGRFPPETEQVIAALRSGRGAGTLSVSSQPAGADVHIDGRLRGRTPTTVRVAAGVHLVRVGAIGQRDKVTLQTVAAARVAQLTVTLTPADAGTQAQQLLRRLEAKRQVGAAATNRAPGALLDRAVLDRAVLDRAARAVGADAWVSRAAAAHEITYVKAAIARRKRLSCRDAGCTRAAARVLYALALGTPPPAPRRASGPTPFYKRWWFWTIVAGAAAGATATGVYLGTRTPSGVDIHGIQR